MSINEFRKNLDKSNLELEGLLHKQGIKVLYAFKCIYCGKIFDEINHISQHLLYDNCKDKIKEQEEEHAKGNN